jgi:hypothetical protein
MKSKQTNRKPSISEFLSYIPVRANYEWSVDEEGLVHIKVPKFQSNLGKKLCRLVRRKETFTADMDRLGSLVWLHCDGKNNVEDILQVLEKEYSDEKDLDQRLFLFLQQMKNLNYISY